MKKQLKEWILPILALFCIIVSLLDFSGLLGESHWLISRIPAYTLLILGGFILYFISLLLPDFLFVKETIESIFNRLKSKQSRNAISEKINFLWKKQESYIKDIFDYIRDENKADNPDFLNDFYKKIAKGEFLGMKVKRPFDFTLTAINSKGIFLYHPNEWMVGRKAIVEEPYDEIFKIRNGEYIWINDRKMSEQVSAITPEILYYRYNRFTKIHFQEFQPQNVIVAFESHMNILHEIPPYKV